MRDVETIVLGYDGSDHSERALERAAELALGLAAQLVVVSVAPPHGLAEQVPAVDPAEAPLQAVPMGPAGTGAPMPLPPTDERRPEPKELARHQLERARMSLTGKRVEAEYVAEVGDAAERLLAVAAERDADLIVVGSKEHGFLDRLLGRHVDEAVAARSQCDVLLVH
jgi:nucleotide-binding universal stress UspA family protein